MASFVRTVLDTAGILVGDSLPEFRDDLLTFGGAATVLAGTILARDSVSLKLVPFVKGGSTNQNGIPKAITLIDVVATGAGDVPVRALVRGEVNTNRLVINADGNATNVDKAVEDQLRAYGLVCVAVKQLAGTDN